MRATTKKDVGHNDLRHAFERLEVLPMRPASARQVAALIDEDDATLPLEPARLPQPTTTDPAWVIYLSQADHSAPDPLAVLERHPWWTSAHASGPVGEAINRLWRHSTAVAIAARKLAREAGDADPEEIARAGFLHNLGAWALAAVDPDRLVTWFQVNDPVARREFEARQLGL